RRQPRQFFARRCRCPRRDFTCCAPSRTTLTNPRSALEKGYSVSDESERRTLNWNSRGPEQEKRAASRERTGEMCVRALESDPLRPSDSRKLCDAARSFAEGAPRWSLVCCRAKTISRPYV